ncbi:MAG: nickel-dependent lactate racemase [Leptolinea sp.]|jgi:nickel-dependent lactate racemase|nr:nickel-dependent lactate racemase [Leptolinea sp.]
MSQILLPYGKSHVILEIADDLTPQIIMPPISSTAVDAHEKIVDSIKHPTGKFLWQQIKPTGRVAIAINDKTRPVPNNLMIPPLLEKLASIGFTPEQITFFIATGTHTPMRSDEFSLLLPSEIISRYRIVSHDCDDSANLEFLGTTSRKTPVWINAEFYHSDLKILVGNIEPHHFMGYSGGAKTAGIGLTGRQTINQNHAMLVEPNATFAIYEENPTRQDLEEIGDLIRIHGVLNVVMNPSRQIMYSLFGSAREVMIAGIPFAREICQTKIDQGDFDLVIASPGGYPKDINLYQSQKGLSHAASITRDGGCVILVAQCAEGVGSNSYEAFMEGITSPDEVFIKMKNDGFKVGPHKALQFAREQKRIRIIIVSDIEKKRIERLLLESGENLETAFKKALISLPPNPRIAIMPKATNTIPQL